MFFLHIDYPRELPAEASESTADEFRECLNRFGLKSEGKNRGERTEEPRDHGLFRKLETQNSCENKIVFEGKF